MFSPLLTLPVHRALEAAAQRGAAEVECSIDLERTRTLVQVEPDHWSWRGKRYPFLDACKDRTVYYWTGERFEPAMRYSGALIKLVPTEWGAPTFEIDGIKMLPTSRESPYADAQRKVALIRPRGKAVLDTCGGLGYFAAWCLELGAVGVRSFEKNPDVLWLRTLNPWSPPEGTGLSLERGDIAQAIGTLAERSFDAVLHDPPRFGIAGELYSQEFYEQLARVLKPRGALFHYTGAPNRITSGRDVPNEVARRLRNAGFNPRIMGDGILAVLERSARA